MKNQLLKWSEQILPWILDHGIKIIIIIVGAYLIQIILRKLIIRAVRIAVVPDGISSEDSEKKREDTLIHIFIGALRISLLVLTGLMILEEIGIMIGPILAGAGIIGLAFGFGGQYLIRDIISGLFIILENQYRVGDVVCFENTCGKVEEVTLRMTTLRDLNGTVHHVPHGEIKKVSNLSKNFSRVNLNIGVSYNSKIEQVIELVNKIGNDMFEDPLWKDSILVAPQFLRIDEFADSAIIIKIVGDTIPHKQLEVTGEFRKRVLLEFRKENIEIPFPQRVIHQAKL